ncbi:MAG: hypothetical protein PHG48_07535 [Eubacteriales bacterium]|nr:hypothetical protein [Eubacteriales bacterium]
MKKTVLSALTTLFVIMGSLTTAQAAPPYKAYTYTTVVGYTWVAPSPAPFIPRKVIDSRSLGVTLKQPEDILLKSGKFYITDTGSNKIIITDTEWNVIREIDGFLNGEQTETFNKPNGCFVMDNGHIFVADTDNSRIVELTNEGELVRVLEQPKSDVFKEDFKYFPRKIVIDSASRIFVVARGVYDGIMELDFNGEFFGFVGSNKVTFSAADLFWKRIYTKEQRDKMIQFIPIEYTNFCLDINGFMYAVTATDANNTPIKKLNPSGKDVLRRSGLVSKVNGDLITTGSQVSITGASNFIDICVDEYDIYNALDSRRGRIFSYDADGNLLYGFGNINTNQVGTFKNPTSIELYGNDLIVADGAQGRLTIFEMTDYALMIRQGVTEYASGLYDESIATWNKVLKYNANFDLAYVQIGKTLIRQGLSQESLEYFKLARFRGTTATGYSKAFTDYRKEYLREHFGVMATSLVVIVILLFIIMRYRNKKKPKNDPRAVILEGGEGI